MAQTVSSDYEDNSAANRRNIDQEVLVSWEDDGEHIPESDRVLAIKIDRSVKVPLAGMHSAQAEITLENSDGRYLSE